MRSQWRQDWKIVQQWLAAVTLCVCLLPTSGYSQPYTPQHDSDVVDTLPSGALTYQDRVIFQPQHKPPFDQISPKIHALLSIAYNQGDPRAVGQAEALLAPYLADQSPETLYLHAAILQSKHEFEAAKSTLQTLLKKTPNQPDSILMMASINLVQGHFAESRQNCDGIRDIGLMVLRLACLAEVDDMTGQITQSLQVLHTLTTINNGLTPDQSQWLYLILADIALRTHDAKLADSTIKHLDLNKAPSLTAQADWLIAQQNWASCIQSLSTHRENDALLLRLTTCEVRSHDPQAQDDLALLGARMQLWQLRGDSSHQREQALYALLNNTDPQVTLAIARSNWTRQKETADLQIYTEAAIHAHSLYDLHLIQAWIIENHFEYPELTRQLTLALKAAHA